MCAHCAAYVVFFINSTLRYWCMLATQNKYCGMRRFNTFCVHYYMNKTSDLSFGCLFYEFFMVILYLVYSVAMLIYINKSHNPTEYLIFKSPPSKLVLIFLYKYFIQSLKFPKQWQRSCCTVFCTALYCFV